MLVLDLMYIILLVISFPYWIHYLFKADYRKHFRLRISPRLCQRVEKTVWVHAVSVGEVKSLKGLIQNLVQVQKKNVILSVSTPSGFEFAKRELAIVEVIPAPFDASFILRRFIRLIQPEIVIFNELELWPNWLFQLHRQRIPILLINGRISEGAFQWYLFFSFFIGRFVSLIDFLVVQSEIYKERFLRLKIAEDKIAVCGNIKADEAYDNLHALPAEREIFAHLSIKRSKKKILTLASSHFQDERVLLEAIDRLVDDYFIILVPRHPKRAGGIGLQLKKRSISYRLFSKSALDPLESKVLIFDEIGYLFPIMAISDIVIMGGTYQRKIGGHNLYEPAVLGKLIVGGRYYHNFLGIGQALERAGVYRRADTANELIMLLNHIDRVDFAKVREDAYQNVLKRRGSVPCSLQHIQKYLSR